VVASKARSGGKWRCPSSPEAIVLTCCMELVRDARARGRQGEESGFGVRARGARGEESGFGVRARGTRGEESGFGVRGKVQGLGSRF
jgi:hypothetical protein